jgi:hypothetical protein
MTSELSPATADGTGTRRTADYRGQGTAMEDANSLHVALCTEGGERTDARWKRLHWSDALPAWPDLVSVYVQGIVSPMYDCVIATCLLYMSLRYSAGPCVDLRNAFEIDPAKCFSSDIQTQFTTTTTHCACFWAFL